MTRARCLARVVVACAVTWATPGFAQPAGAGLAHTPWGDPDLQGYWNNSTLVPMERPANYAGMDSLTDEEVAERAASWSALVFADRPGDPGFYNEFWMEYGQDTNRTSLVIDRPDGKLPAQTPRAAEVRQAIRDGWRASSRAPATYLDLTLADRCLTRGMPGTMTPGYGYNHNYHILQTPDYVVINVELIHDTRIIPIDGRPHPSPTIRQWLGVSHGHWDGNTLVVETTNLTDRVTERNGGPTVFGIGENLHLVERFTRVSDDTIDYRYTVEDSTTFEEAWTAAIPMHKIEGPIFEYACHEGNHSIPNILLGARAIDRAHQPD